MESSDEDGEMIANRVTKYYFVDSSDNVISFASLPLQGNDKGGEECSKQKMGLAESAFLRGMVEDGQRNIYVKVVAWKFELSYAHPEIYVLLDGEHGRWILLQRPKNGYETIVRTVLISVHCLHFIKKNSEEESRDALWKHIRKSFSNNEVPPSVNDLVDHEQWIKEAAMEDTDIVKAKMLPYFLSEMPRKRKSFHEVDKTVKKPKFEDYMDDVDVDDLNGAEKDELFDRVCALCDDGGDILGCEAAMQTFLCKNCQYQQHQCFICGRLGSSDKSFGAEVFPCVSATCGYFYHPQCVSQMVFPGDESQAQRLQKTIENGDSFTCPAHRCYVCKKGEDKNIEEMQFAICRRCPKAYHRKCLPRNILFECNDAKNIPQRPWEGLLIKRILIYCKDHKLCRELLTPKRVHIVFPDIHGKREQHSSGVLPDKLNVLPGRRSKAYAILTDEIKLKKLSKEKTGGSINKNDKKLTGKVSKGNLSPNKPSTTDKTQSPWRSGKSESMPSTRTVAEKMPTVHACTLRTEEMEKRIQKLMNESSTSIDMDEFLDQQRRNYNSPPFNLGKTITMGKVEYSVQAIRAALKRLEERGTIEDAKAVCEPAIITQMIKWKKKLGVYLAPFIHGMRYTSFGRHFTKVDKLKQVVNRLRWYVQDGDTIVDYCCGSNDFSCLMKEELERMRRQCYFKNYDLIQPKNNFNFEKRDWMSICLEELPEGSNLIMGLNLPFGVQAFHANQFINKALTFRPKLLILIVPRETERLDVKKIPYDLIWEDGYICSGKAFYLPGSVNVHDQQIEQWNIEPPHLYLWSRQDWTTKHKEVAAEHGHLIDQGVDHTQGTSPSAVSNYLMEENHDRYGDSSSVLDGYCDNCTGEDLPEPSHSI